MKCQMSTSLKYMILEMLVVMILLAQWEIRSIVALAMDFHLSNRLKIDWKWNMDKICRNYQFNNWSPAIT